VLPAGAPPPDILSPFLCPVLLPVTLSGVRGSLRSSGPVRATPGRGKDKGGRVSRWVVAGSGLEGTADVGRPVFPCISAGAGR
jgi:hypothetical protein